jgi:hypothetical protein
MRHRFEEHHLEWVRSRIFIAHSVEVRGGSLYDVTNYEMSEVESCIPVDDYDPRNRKTERKHMAEIKTLRGDFFVVKAREVRAGKSSVPLAPSAFEDSRVVKTVHELPLEQQHWLRYAYSDVYTWDDECGATVALWELFKPSLDGSRSSTVDRCKGLAYLCIQDFKHSRLRGEPKYPPSEVQRLSSIPEGNWRRDWLPRWREMQSLLARLDREALTSMLNKINAVKHSVN